MIANYLDLMDDCTSIRRKREKYERVKYRRDEIQLHATHDFEQMLWWSTNNSKIHGNDDLSLEVAMQCKAASDFEKCGQK